LELQSSGLCACSGDGAARRCGTTRNPPIPTPVHGGVKVFGPYLDGDCDPLVPSHFGYPFRPTSISSKTGRR
jgi:hypothetical protein